MKKEDEGLTITLTAKQIVDSLLGDDDDDFVFDEKGNIVTLPPK